MSDKRAALTLSCTISLVVGVLPARGYTQPFLWYPSSTIYGINCGACCGDYLLTTCHVGIDYLLPRDAEVRAAAEGTVVRVDRGFAEGQYVDDYPYGNHVRIRHPNGYETRYGHMLPGILVAKDDVVQAGQLLGYSDDTGFSSGSHLHFEVRDPSGHAVDPYTGRIIPRNGNPADFTPSCSSASLWASCPPVPFPASCTDNDGDGACVEGGEDCDDTHPRVFTGGVETCDFADNDCDGVTDEEWRGVGTPGALGTTCAVGDGLCTRYGSWTCAASGEETMCSAIPASPEEEVCDRYDNDCDGAVDEGWGEGPHALDLPCTVGTGACTRYGLFVCSEDGSESVCSSPPGDSVPETCNGLDDDCDGLTDENWEPSHGGNLWEPCSAGENSCREEGVYECAPDGLGTRCSATARTSEPERCDGIDNDCDGLTDEEWRTGLTTDIGRACTITWAECGGATTSGMWVCAPGGLSTVCNAPEPEGC